MKHLKKLSEVDYEDIFSLSEFAFQYQLTNEQLETKQKEIAIHDIWGWMEDGKLAAKLHIIPLQCYIGGQIVEMGGISAVATWPEYRRKGIVKQLLHHSLKEMKKNGQLVSFLAPFSFKFYRKYGWELGFVNKNYSIPMESLKQVKWHASGVVRRIEKDYPLLQSIYSDYARQFNGMLVRNEHWWKYRIFNEKSQIAVSYNADGKSDGYLIYQVKNNLFKVEEIVYQSVEAKKVLFQFIANHDSMAKEVEMTVPENDSLPILMEDPIFKQELKPYFMVRIVDVEAFLHQYPFREVKNREAFSITVKDEFFQENEGTYQISNKQGAVKFSGRTTSELNLHCSIQMLSMIMLNYKRAEELWESGLISGDRQAAVLLDTLVPERQTHLADFF